MFVAKFIKFWKFHFRKNRFSTITKVYCHQTFAKAHPYQHEFFHWKQLEKFQTASVI